MPLTKVIFADIISWVIKMKYKRILVAVLSLSIVFSFAACKKNETPTSVTAASTFINENGEIEYATVEEITEDTQANVVTEIETVTAIVTDEAGETFTVVETQINHVTETTQKLSENPAEWSKSQIINEYINAAKRTNPYVTTQQKVLLKSISVNNGQFEGLFDFVTSVMSKFIEDNTTETSGITGGYENLSEADVTASKAYKKGKSTMIEITLADQISGGSDDIKSGSVGHGINTIGDIYVVAKQLADKGIPLDFTEEDISIHYTNATVKVELNSKGQIIGGTWSYTVEIRLDDYQAFGKPVETTSVIMENTLTVNGGFEK